MSALERMSPAARARWESIGSVIRQAVVLRNLRLVRRVADSLRQAGLNYQKSYALVNGIAPISLAEWDALLAEADNCEGA